MVSVSKLVKRKQEGFTLVEVIVVLVILAILAAILIPTLTGYIDKANERAAIAETRACVMAAQTLASENYSGVVTETLDETAIKNLAEVGGTVDAFVLGTGDDAGTITSLTYTSEAGIECTYTPAGGYAIAD